MPRADLEIAREFLRLSDEGLSYNAIGQKLGFNNKTVSFWVKKAKASEKTRLTETTGTDLNTRYTSEHHRMILAAARGIHKAVSAPLSSAWEGQEAKVLLEHQILIMLQDMDDILSSRGINIRPGEPGYANDSDFDLLESMAASLIQGLFQHIPKLGDAVETWSYNRDELHVRRSKIMLEVTSVLTQFRQVSDNAATDLASKAFELVLSGEATALIEEASHGDDLAFAVKQTDIRTDDVRELLGLIDDSVADCKELVADMLLWGGAPGKCRTCSVGGKGV